MAEQSKERTRRLRFVRSAPVIEAASNRATVGRRIVTALALGGVLLVGLGPASAATLVIPGDADGSCYVSARANGALFNMQLDTGSIGDLTFGRNHAAQLGYNSSSLHYDNEYGSVNGTGHEANIRLREFRLGNFVMRDVPATITKAPQDAPLIGIEILHRLNLALSGGNCELRLP
jgi:clan AA aspartic protease (TIGR02281 family)